MKGPPSLARGLTIALGLVALSTAVAQAADCMDRFPQGRFGILPSHPAVAKLALEGFSPLYLKKQPITISRPEDCQYVYTGDVFRMVDTRAAGTLLAGCVGDFDGDGRADVKSWVGGGNVNVIGDLFTIGWKTYFWNPTAGRFDGILTTD
jgi:hypothetical protein